MCFSPLITLLITTTAPTVHFEPLHTLLSFDEPVQVVCDNVDKKTIYVVEKAGRVIKTGTTKTESKKTVFLDITDRVGAAHDEEGLLSAVFHPSYVVNGEIYVWYTAQNPRRGVLSKFTKNKNENTINNKSEKIVLEVNEPWGNHNGGTVLFGVDGYLYLGIGDGGSANDPHNNGQNKNTLLGSIIRIDVSGLNEDSPYTIPPDNPLVGKQGVREELWAWGLRNPWRMSFDRETGQLWAGDVGQNSWEEIDIIYRGGNYGWKLREGKHRFKKNKNNEPEGPTFIEPVHEYGRKSGGSVTGGYVYRGKEVPELTGFYIFSDYLSKKIWALFPSEENENVFIAKRIAKSTPVTIASFGETIGGEILICGFPNPYSPKGKIYRLSPSESPEPPWFSDSAIPTIR